MDGDTSFGSDQGGFTPVRGERGYKPSAQNLQPVMAKEKKSSGPVSAVSKQAKNSLQPFLAPYKKEGILSGISYKQGTTYTANRSPPVANLPNFVSPEGRM